MSKQELILTRSLVNQPGFLGFSPSQRGLETIREFEDWGGFGAFITDPISWHPRPLAEDSDLLEADGQVIIHTGFPNRGFNSAIRSLEGKWARSPLPIIPSLLETEVDRILEMARRLETFENVAALHLMPPTRDLAELNGFLAVLPQFGAELPLILSLPGDLILLWGKTFISAGVAAFLPSPPRVTIERKGYLFSGRSYGPCYFPVSRHLASECAKRSLPLIAAGGIDSHQKVKQLASEHPIALALDLALW